MGTQEITITPEQFEHMKKLMEKEEKRKAYSRRVAIKNQLFVEKAKAAGIKVSYGGPGFLGHENEVNIVFKEVVNGKG